jgi:fluoroacetyl-CoA thioesterase
MFSIALGTTHEIVLTVDDKTAIRFLENDRARVLGTPSMIAWMEMAARDAIVEQLPEGYDTVGTMVNVRHVTAAPMGTEVRFFAKVLEVRERRVYFRVECHGAHGIVGEGTHERYIINVERFAKRLDAKR